jgi:23S rRNA (guanosine2251-2'-O)-methyltransferase
MAAFHKKQRPKKSTLIVGRQPVAEAIRAGKPIDKILLQKSAGGEMISRIRELASIHQVPIQYVPVEKLNGLTTTLHQGVIAIISVVQFYDLQQIISHVTGNGQVPLFLLLDGITDVRNIGAIARTAVACGAQALIIPDKGIAALQEDAVKASAGALEKIYVCRVNSLMKAVDELHLNGIRVFASEMTSEKKIFECNFREPCAIVMGSEDKGIFPALMKICDEPFRIPMPGDFESLNVSVAAGMILYEVMKQRLPG